MKFSKPPGYQLIGFVISMPFISWGINAIMYDERLYRDWRIWVFSFPLIIFLGFLSFYLHYQYVSSIRRRFPEIKQTGKRIFYIFLVFLFVMVPSVLIIFFLYGFLGILGYRVTEEDLKLGLLIGFTINVIFETLWEVVYIIEKYKENIAEKELLEHMSLTQEFENLKGQLNPHFLFNCFNTLSSLIGENKKGAEAFLDELSKVYRYLLRTNQEGVATLESELKFINSYYQLLKTRHGDALHLQVEVDRKYYSYLLPSLSLQLLIENAVKHNIVSRQQPLMIEIFTTSANQLVVNNNLQHKLKKESSTNIGLNNIRLKYKLMQQPGFQVVEGEKNFMVVLPLVWNNTVVTPGQTINEKYLNRPL